MTRHEAANCMMSQAFNDAEDYCRKCPYYMSVKIGEGQYICKADEAFLMAKQSLEAWDKLKEAIIELKQNQNSENTDYATGYMSALSTVEGVIAEMEIDDE